MQDQKDSGGIPTPNSKLITKKRICCDSEEERESEVRRLKMNGLDADLRSKDRLQFGKDMSEVTNVPMILDDVSPEERREETAVSIGSLDLNTEACAASNLEMTLIGEHADKKVSSAKEHKKKHDSQQLNSGGISLELDLNAEVATNSLKKDPFYGNKSCDNLRSREISECGSTTGPVEEKDPLKVWREMKQNGFLSSSHGGMSFGSGLISSSHGGIPVPKQRGRKRKTDTSKKKMELAEKEEVNRFAKVAAPSGLLHGLNPGIINHVRNKKQVYSIIKALVKSEQLEKECKNKAANQTGGHTSVGEERDATAKYGLSDRNWTSHSAPVGRKDDIALKLSSSTKTSDESSTFSNEDSPNISSVSSLSVRAASVAFQWLDLIHHDIRGRLTALQCSKKRVRAVISTELPHLLAKEFSYNEENNPYAASNDGLSIHATASLHQTRWSRLFEQMDKALSNEEKQLEELLSQVTEMRWHCSQGLKHFQCDPFFDFQQHAISETYTRIRRADSTEKELSVRAAAASIYSTCNFLKLTESMAS